MKKQKTIEDLLKYFIHSKKMNGFQLTVENETRKVLLSLNKPNSVVIDCSETDIVKWAFNKIFGDNSFNNYSQKILTVEEFEQLKSAFSNNGYEVEETNFPNMRNWTWLRVNCSSDKFIEETMKLTKLINFRNRQ